MNVAIIGCGLIGKKRAESLLRREARRVRRPEPRARASARRPRPARARPTTGARSPTRRTSTSSIVATPHDSLAEITLAAVDAGKHVLVEKPAARSAAELEPVVAEAERRGALVRVGFNHRYHRAFRKARELVDAARSAT